MIDQATELLVTPDQYRDILAGKPFNLGAMTMRKGIEDAAGLRVRFHIREAIEADPYRATGSWLVVVGISVILPSDVAGFGCLAYRIESIEARQDVGPNRSHKPEDFGETRRRVEDLVGVAPSTNGVHP